MKAKRTRGTRRNAHTAFKATALLLVLLARDYCAADPAIAPGAPRKVAEGAVLTERDQIRHRVFELAGAGSPQLALEEARKRPDSFAVKDLMQIEALLVSGEVRWGRQQALASDDADRLAQSAAALEHIDAFLTRIPDGDDYADVRRSAQADRVEALQCLGRMKDAVMQYEALLYANGPLPARVHAAAGEAYTYLDSPRQAAPAYERALKTPLEPIKPSAEPHALKRIDVEEGLFFAYLDAGRSDDAQAFLQSTKKSTPVYADLSGHAEEVNEDYGRVRKLEAQYLLYTDRTREGIAALDALRQDAPFDASLISARSDAALVQERPRQAQKLYQDTLVDHPGDIETLAGLGKTEIELYQYDRAEAINAEFADRFPDSNTVKNFQRGFEAYKSAQLIVEGNGQKGNSALADNDWGIDTQRYSQPIANYWRVFAHNFSGRADTGDGSSTSRVRNGIGGDFRYYGFDAAAEVDHSTGPHAYTGVAGTVALQPNDHWKFSAGIDTNDNSLPWKAYQAGVTGRTASAAARWQFDDYRYFDLSYGVSRYSDTNLHQQWNGTWYERLFNTPKYEISMWVDLDTNGNTLANTAYFNPHRDMAAQVTTMFQWTPWRNVDKSFSQRVYATAGGYRQTSLGNSLLWEVRLEQAWQLGTRASLAYGVGVASQRFDTSRETSKLIYLNLDMPL
ncbi:poly-beta-1,6 N-acetyl-D-glucosamine export porin PgaA [Trinickia terrae]|uniref:Poly-beta-1,6 N-acetyl-D-glucosamine export porin PgaA n=1 Tax=Trinickia terrae TaxID=2571161 RepID=A0A4U1HP02_9BURK|nr:poly-beta-1,6 N-acetyl-D-glucosamine export porin PgaA [Trinickia terrae]TKC83109.1 poly-beta-1,6 N-acetyl-D-glucosamine export porin PgaA [Trinickia terrae]